MNLKYFGGIIRRQTHCAPCPTYPTPHPTPIHVDLIYLEVNMIIYLCDIDQLAKYFVFKHKIICIKMNFYHCNVLQNTFTQI